MIARFNGNVVPFADDATLTNRTVFGGTTQSDDIDDNLNADFKKGWEIVGLNDNPTREDFNAMGYTLGALISYLYEMGISEWNASQNYRINSRVIGSDGKIYKALTGTTVNPNAGNNPTSDAVNWELEFKNFVDLINNQTIAGIKTFTSSPIVPTPASGDNSTKVATTAFVKAKSESNSIGIGQTWQNVTSSRSAGVTYTNSTGKPIFVTARIAAGNISSITVNGVIAMESYDGASVDAAVCAIVPNGGTYSFSGGTTLQHCAELR